MRNINIDREWVFGYGTYDLQNELMGTLSEEVVNLPHDYMLRSEVTPNAASGSAAGYYNAAIAYYRKIISIPSEWSNEEIFLHFDGVMMNATVGINGCRLAQQHSGYTPFTVNIGPYISYGEPNTITISVNPCTQPNSRWYTGAGIIRSVELIHAPKLYIKQDGIFAYTDRIAYDGAGNAEYAVIKAQIDVCSTCRSNHIAEVELTLCEEKTGREAARCRTRIQINEGKTETACMSITTEEPLLWDNETPNLYVLKVTVTDCGEFRTHFIQACSITKDTCSTLFGIRTICVDARKGLQINGKTVKLKGGCLHHDNGVAGAVSLYDAEFRKLSILKSSGFNAVRTAHNPPSAAFIEAADRLGMYVLDEAFDCWTIGKQPGDYSLFFETDWKKDLQAFILRDRTHPSVIIWSTGNEIGERGGLANGYTIAAELARTVKELDPSRPVTNGICSFWSGLDDELQTEKLKGILSSMQAGGTLQNADSESEAEGRTWAELTECFTNGLDIVGYNYLENRYTESHKRFPERIILGSENYPNEIGIRWPMVESTPYVIGDFTWTAFDYIGEAGIGKAFYFSKDDPVLKTASLAVTSAASEYPWRTANCGDYDITGMIKPQGMYRQVVWGSKKTHLLCYPPEVFGKQEILSRWGFIGVEKSWTWPGYDGHEIQPVVFSDADEVELFINGTSQDILRKGERPAGNNPPLPKSFLFDAVYTPGIIEAVSRTNGVEVSRDILKTRGEPTALRLVAEPNEPKADGHTLIYVHINAVDNEGNVVPYASCRLTAELEGNAELIGFGSGASVTAQNYTTGEFDMYHGTAIAVIRAGYVPGKAKLIVKAPELGEEKMTFNFIEPETII